MTVQVKAAINSYNYFFSIKNKDINKDRPYLKSLTPQAYCMKSVLKNFP